MSKRQTAFLAALLAGETVARACFLAKIATSTGFKYLQDDNFQLHWRAARRAIIESAISEMQNLTGEAVQALRKVLSSPNQSAVVRAASVILQRSLEGLDLLDYDARISSIENAIGISKPKAKAL